MKHLIPLPIICFLLTGFTGCEKPTEPKDTPEPDTTSHRFVWRVDTIGTYLSLVRDVAIVDENDIWAVGEFYKKHSTFDSTTKDQYNAAHWDGVRWELKRFPFDFGTYSESFPYEINAVFGLENSTIWGASGATPIRLENEKWQAYSMAGISNNILVKIWGLDDTHIWFVGNNGTILFYNGTTFTKIPYDESVDFVDVWGDETGVVRAVARERNGYKSALVKIENGNSENEILGSGKPEDSTIPDIFHSVWWKNDGSHYWNVSSNGVYVNENGNYKKMINHYAFSPWIGTLVVRGCAENDIFLAGIHGQIMHFNGSRIHFYSELYTPYLQFNTLCFKKNVMCAGGRYEGTAITLVGKRMN